MIVKNRMVKPRWRKQFRVFENDNLVFKNGVKPLGADASACNAFRAKICPSKAFKLRTLSAPRSAAIGPAKAPNGNKGLPETAAGAPPTPFLKSA